MIKWNCSVQSLLITICLAIGITDAHAMTIEGDWTAYTESSATGVLDGTLITGTAGPDGPFFGIAEDQRFWPFGQGGWDASFWMSMDTRAIIAVNVNDGDWHEFEFAAPIDSPSLYIENFDSNSIATITATGSDSISLLSGSPSISFEPSSSTVGLLQTSNPTFNGEGDAIIFLEGPVTGVRIDYSGGDGANGVFYGFGLVDTSFVPEPSGYAAMFFAGIAALLMRRRR